MMTTPQRGFTLLEVLVALIIISVALTAIFYALYADNRIASDLQTKTFAYWVAKNTLADYQVRNAHGPNLPSSEEGEGVQLGHHWKWTINVQPTPTEHVFAVIVDVKMDQETTGRALLRGYLGVFP